MRSLRAQLTRASMLTTLAALLLSAGSLLVYEWVAYRGAWVNDLRTQADLIAYSSAAALVFNDPKSAQENLALLHQKPRIRAAAVFDVDGKPFATYVIDRDVAAPRQIDPTLLDVGSRFDGSMLRVAYPILHDGESIGTVYLQAEHDVWTRAATYAAIEAVVIAAALALAYVVYGRLQRTVTDPLARITNVARDVVERRDWKLRAPDATNPDISVLVNAFNAMLSEVEARTGELEREMVVRQHAEAELRVADRKKDEFLATLAHELRNPLAPMSNAVALLRRPAADAAMRERASSILERQLRHMVRLIDDLLDVSRVATGKLSLHRGAIDLVAVLHAAIELAEPMARERRLRLVTELPPTPLPMLADAARLTQVFSNLLNNACRYTPDGGRVDVGMGVHGGVVEVRVRDTGIGIDPALQQRIFELFEQADKSLERGSAGLGIGLTLARQLVQLHGGEISVESAGLGHGSCFSVRLPLAQPHDEAAPGAPVERAPADRGGLRVLIADDNVDFAGSLQLILEMRGHRVAVAHDGLAALRAAHGEPPDVAVLDIGMPGLNGYEVARQLRAQRPDSTLKLIAMTGWGQASDRQAASEAGFDHHLVKPVAPDDLLALLARVAAPARSHASDLEDLA